LVYSYGIVALALVSGLLIIVFQASVTALIPLYAIGVFLSFTLSQTGMARRWWKSGHLLPGQEVREPGSVLRYAPGWQVKMAINAFGALCTAIVVIVFAVTKFQDGAWIVIFLTPTLVFIFFRIHAHYKHLAKRLSLENYQPRVPTFRHRVILPIGGVHQGTLEALHYARMLSYDLTAVHVSVDPTETESVKNKWAIRGEETRLVILDSPYRVMLKPLLAYIEEMAAQRQHNERITIVVPQFVPKQWWHNLLHMQTATFLRFALLLKKNIVVTDVPYQIE
jgi:hypothetical protein